MSLKKQSPFTIPEFLKTAVEGNRPLQLTFSEIKDTNILSTSSFIYDSQDAPLKSTQQLNVDWSLFQNHCFFMSAEAKVNLAFEQIINGFPFDGSKKEIEHFFEKLSGFDKWVFDNFPKYHGQLMFSGTTLTESDPSLGTYISVTDAAGALYPELSKKSSGQSILNPKDTSLSIEMHIFVPQITTDGTQIVCQKLNGTTQGYSLYLTPTTSTSSVDATFAVVSGSSALSVSYPLDKGKFNHICVILNKESDVHYLEFFKSAESQLTSRKQTYLGNFDIDASNFLIGSGTTITIDGVDITPQQTFSGTIDEFRVYHSKRTSDLQRNFASKAIYAKEDLKLYYKFNEPPPPLTTNLSDQSNAIVIDSSGNSLHSVISNFFDYADYDMNGNITGSSLRQNALNDGTSLMNNEKDELSIVLFPAHADVVSLNLNLLTSASEYDRVNPNLISRLVPKHYLLEGAYFDGLNEPDGTIIDSYGGSGMPGQGQLGSAQLFLSMLYIWAKFFDEMKLFVDAFSTLKTIDYNSNVSLPNNFLRDMIRQFGFNIPPLFSDSTIDQYINAENIDNIVSTSDLSLKQVQNELLRRILINLPDVIKSKGTQHSIKSFLRAIGIDPENSLRIREFGGANNRQLTFSRENKRIVSTMVDMITSSFIVSPYLSSSRYEPGWPEISGTFVLNEQFSPNGISDCPSDGLLTSGSWSVETLVKYTPYHISCMTSATQSILRLNVTGTFSGSDGLIANLLVISSSLDPKLMLYLRPGVLSTSPTLQLTMSVPSNAIFDSDKWHISFGCARNDNINSRVSSSYYLSLATQNAGEITFYKSTSSFFDETPNNEINVLRTIDSVYNTSGAFMSLGENYIPQSGSTGYQFLNNITSVDLEARVTAFTGLLSNLRFWSKCLTESEIKEHVKNPKSLGVENPLSNYNFVKTQSGSFEKLRLDSLNKQEVRRANATASLGEIGSITFLDFSLNGLHLTGTGFSTTNDCLRGEIYDINQLSPYFDEASCDEKIRIRSFQNQDLVNETPWAQTAPIYEIVKSEQPTDDVRFSIEFSLIDSLNKDIVTMFSSFDALASAIGSPELIYAPDYPDLDRMRDIYFNRLSEKLNFKEFFEFFRWFENSMGMFIQQLIPRKTDFKGTNFVIESHMLERHKLQYCVSEQYLATADRQRIKDVLLLQQISGNVRKY